MEKDTFRTKIMDIFKDFVEKSYYNNGKPWKSSRILRLKPNFFMFLHFLHVSSFLLMFLRVSSFFKTLEEQAQLHELVENQLRAERPKPHSQESWCGPPHRGTKHGRSNPGQTPHRYHQGAQTSWRRRQRQSTSQHHTKKSRHNWVTAPR